MKRESRVVVVVGILIGTTLGHADNQDLATSNALFEEGKRLLVEDRTDEACARFEASMRAAPRLGVQLNLADCYERLGRTASAWGVYGEAAARARALADPREAYARGRIAALLPRLSRISIAATSATVTRDGVRVPPDAFGVAIPVDPGSHAIEASAPDHVPWSTRVVAREGTVVTVEVPELALAVRAAAPGPRRLSRATLFAGSVGIAGLAAGSYFGLSARALWRDAEGGCDGNLACNEVAFDQANRGRRHANIATATFVIGGVAAATGLVLYLRAPRRVHVTPTVSNGVGMIVGGRF